MLKAFLIRAALVGAMAAVAWGSAHFGDVGTTESTAALVTAALGGVTMVLHAIADKFGVVTG